MIFKKWFNRVSIGEHSIYSKMLIICGLFFIMPVIGLMYLSVTYNILQDPYFVPFLFVVLVSVIFGFLIL